MTDQEFAAHVRRLEELARRDPARYRIRVVALAVLGYAYLLGVLAGVGALTLGAAWASWQHRTGGMTQLAVFSGAVVLDIVRALWVRLTAPRGLPLTRPRDGALLDRVDEICRTVGAPRPHVVLATPELNAAVTQIPRLGILGWQKNYLLLGLPLMRALSPAEFDALLAHEFGHLAGAHSRFASWIYRLRMSWRRLLEALERKQSVGGRLFRRFARWYAPRFNATSFVQARLHEYEADQAAARLCTPRTAADTLLRVAIATTRTREEYWPALYGRARVLAEPPQAAFEMLGHGLESGELPSALRTVSRSEADIIAEALAVDTTFDDTHPCLRERLAALGVDVHAEAPGPIATSAAAHYLGERARELEAVLSQQWRQQVHASWSSAFTKAKANRARLAQLEASAPSRPLNVHELWEQADCLWTEERRDEALVIVRGLAEQHPEFAPAQRHWGMYLLASDDEAGLAHIERALAHTRRGGASACRAAQAFLVQRGRIDEARAYAERARIFEQWQDLAQAERVGIDANSEFLPHALGPEALEALRAQLRVDRRIARAWLVRKLISVAPEYPVHVLMIAQRGSWRRFSGALAQLQQETAERVELDGDWLCVDRKLVTPWWVRRRIRAAAGDPIYIARG